ncbi:Hypothetical predicted protein [Marmota monax]|uniref:Inactive hydroxysteroid dehydrogenase-like protein 1 n=1 Tax=Marmota monax TaxID=9995 RepID=A0A5E4A3J3_MARMO|nr:Hypothetical predicted protein [Marmota monax]
MCWQGSAPGACAGHVRRAGGDGGGGRAGPAGRAPEIVPQQVAMAAVDSFYLLYREIARSCNCYMEALALVGAWYTARKSITVICDFYSLIRLHFIPRLGSRADLTKQYGRWAVVSGATDGIGKAYAEELASRGLNVILMSRNEEKLRTVAKDIADTYQVETDIIVVDFSRGREIYVPVAEALRDKDIGILVNNVGVFHPYPQYFTQVSEDKLWDIINVNIAAASLMIHIVLPGMVERKKGAIVTISSGSCCKPTPQLAAFSASKAYLDHLSRALQYEYASKGIFVQSLLPFYVATNMAGPSSFLHRCPWLVPSPKVYAHHAVSTLGISKRTTGYWSHSIQVAVCFQFLELGESEASCRKRRLEILILKLHILNNFV